MAKSVVIVETAAKAKTLKDQLGDEVDVILVQSVPVKVSYVPPAERLHREVPNFTFAPEPKEQEFIDRLVSCQGREIYLGLDSDWRGDFWSWLINGYWEALTGGGSHINRLQIAGLGGDALRESFRRVEPVRTEKAAATYIRMLFDSSLGKHLQRLLGSRSGPGGLALNYLSLTTLFLLAERETEIRMYTPASRWRIKAKASTGRGEVLLRLEEAYGITDDGLLRNEKEVKSSISLFDKGSFVVGDIAVTPMSVPAPAPYRLVDLLHDCVVQEGLKPLAAMTAIRNLYHGVDIEGKQQGLITAFLPQGQEGSGVLFPKIREQVGRRMGEGRIGPEKRYEDFSGLILPALPEFSPEDLAGKLGSAEHRVYKRIWSRALASQMHEAKGEVVQVTVEAGEDCLFSGSGKRILEQGFLVLHKDSKAQELLAPCSLAGVGEGAVLQCLQILPEKNVGLPPEHFTFESLALDLADFSLDFDAITVAMLQQMLDCGYLRMMPDGSFRCAENTGKLISVMNRAFPSMKGINFSAYLAQTIEEAVSGRKSLAFALQQFEQTLFMRGEVLVKPAVPLTAQKRGISSRSIIRMPEEVGPANAAAGKEAPLPVSGAASVAVQQDEACPPSSEPGPAATPSAVTVTAEEVPAETSEIIPVAEAGPAEDIAGEEALQPVASISIEEPDLSGIAASGEEGAAAEAIFAEAPSPVGEDDAPAKIEGESAQLQARTGAGQSKPCPDCGRPLLLKEDRFGKFWYCSGHPECRHSESYGKEGVAEMFCPLCRKGNVVSKHTPTGKLFYVCPEQDCEFMAWAKPHSIPCSVCDSPFLVEKKVLSGKAILRCPRAGCNYMQPLAGGTEGVEAAAAEQPARKKVLVRRVGKGASSAGGPVRKVRIVRKKK